MEQVAEEMERLILQQLEEEERAKELSIKVNAVSFLRFLSWVVIILLIKIFNNILDR